MRLLTWFFIIFGLLLIVVSLYAHEKGLPEFWVKLLETLGVTIASVFGVKLAYDSYLAKEHFSKFHDLIKKEFSNFQNLTGACISLGIIEAFPNRSGLLEKHALQKIISNSRERSTIRCVGLSLFHVMNNTDSLRDGVIKKGLTIELCFMDPDSCSKVVEDLTELRIGDIYSSLKSGKILLDGLSGVTSEGQLEIRTHRVLLFESLLTYGGSAEKPAIVILDMSFGRDTDRKRVLILDPAKLLGSDMVKRYQKIWDTAEQRAKYNNGYVNFKGWQGLLDK